MNPLRFTLNTPESDLRQAIVEVGRIAYQRSLLTASDGNISVRLPDGNILITPAGLCKGRLDPDDLLDDFLPEVCMTLGQIPSTSFALSRPSLIFEI